MVGALGAIGRIPIESREAPRRLYCKDMKRGRRDLGEGHKRRGLGPPFRRFVSKSFGFLARGALRSCRGQPSAQRQAGTVRALADDTATLPNASVTCNQAAPAGTVTTRNPNKVVFDDPANSGKVWSTLIRGRAAQSSVTRLARCGLGGNGGDWAAIGGMSC